MWVQQELLPTTLCSPLHALQANLSQQQQQWEPSVYNQYPMNLCGINPRCLKQSVEERRQETFQGKERKWCRPGKEGERYNSWWTQQQVKRKKGKDYRVYRGDQSVSIERWHKPQILNSLEWWLKEALGALRQEMWICRWCPRWRGWEAWNQLGSWYIIIKIIMTTPGHWNHCWFNKASWKTHYTSWKCLWDFGIKLYSS